MTAHVGPILLMILVAAWAFFRSGRRFADTIVVGLACATILLRAALWIGESSVDDRWSSLARRELTARTTGIVTFLREKGTTSLEAIRAVGDDPDTRALLSTEEQLARTARRPVFLDLMEHFPPAGSAGVTVYDRSGVPRAWSGWSPTATMAPRREPSSGSDVVSIRGGNIYTLLEATHPIIVDGVAIGFVVYQEPLRVQFPLQNRLLRVEDVLGRLEGGGGVRADVALELTMASLEDIASIQSGPLKMNVADDLASATASIVSESGAGIGRVSLSGLSRQSAILQRVGTLRRVSDAFLFAALILACVRVWFALPSVFGPNALRPRGLGTLILRSALVVVARGALMRWSPRDSLDPFGVFDPSWFASIRFGGLLRSPADLMLTALAALLLAREARRFLRDHSDSLSAFGRRHPFLCFVPGTLGTLLVGSLLGFHWTRVMDVARNANVPLFGGLDPFTSLPVAVLELFLLLIGGAFLLTGDAIVTWARACFRRIPAPIAAIWILGLALFASAVKVPAPEGASVLDFFRPIPALAALAVFHVASRRWLRPGAATILFLALLASIVNFAPLSQGIDSRRRELVELFALEHTESPSNSRHFLLESTLEFLTESEELRTALDAGAGPEHANLAFILWAKSPLANVGAGCHLRILDENGVPFSNFSLGFPPELQDPAPDVDTVPTKGTRFRREDIGTTRIDLYSGRVPLRDHPGGRTRGLLELSMAYVDDMHRARRSARALPSLFTNVSAPAEFLRFTREVPDRMDRYRGEQLVASTDPEGGLGKRVPSIVVQTLAEPSAGGRWVERRISGKLFDLFCVRERDGEVTVGYLTFGIERFGLWQGASLLARSILVTLVLAAAMIALLMVFAWLASVDDRARWNVPRIGFRERVIAGFLLVSLLPTVFLGFAGRGLFVQEKRKEFQERLEEDLRVSQELLGTRLSDAARNAAGTTEIRDLLRPGAAFTTISKPASVEGIFVLSKEGAVLGASESADLGIAYLSEKLLGTETQVEFFRRRGSEIYSCSFVPIAGERRAGRQPVGSVLAFQRVDPVIASELERRVGSSVSFFAHGQLTATSKPELYQSEILSDLVESIAYLKIELEGARRTLVESRVGSTSFLSIYAPLPDENGNPVGILATLAAFQGGGLDLDASLVLSRIYFLCLLVFTGAIASAVVMASRLARPISELTLGAERIGQGGLGHRIESKATGEIGALVRSFNSMSERLAESEQRDRERREYIEAIIRHVGSGVVSFDADGRIATVNEAASRVLGVEATELIGRLPEDVPGSAALSALVDAVDPVLRGGREEVVHEVEAPGEDPEGELRSIRLVATLLADHEGNPQGAVAVFEDLTDLIKSKKIKAWAEMARQVAHEIKNPLTPMKLSAQHLRQAWRDRHPKFDKILEESTETIVDRCEALRRIAIEFSDYARMPGRQMRREDLGRLLHEARRLYGDSADRHVDFRLDAPEAELWTRVDRDEILRLFINLIENSIQAMPSGGDLFVTASRDNGSALVTIRDSGLGIPAENLIRIFEPSFSTKTGGAGLGLPICKAIMEDYGGSIDISSRAGEGTTVRLVFPVDASPADGGADS